MYDKGKIITGVVIALVLVTFPLSYLAASGDGGYVPEPELPADEEACVESAEWMSENHMRLLDDWRTSVVRGDDRTYVASDGTEYEISLSGTCLGCHQDKAEFCDKCHTYTGTEPKCWNCHVAGEE